MTEPTTTQQTGTILKIVRERGFGFITPTVSTPDASSSGVFFHRSACDAFESLQENDRVSYIPESSLKGPRASAVAPL